MECTYFCGTDENGNSTYFYETEEVTPIANDLISCMF